MVKARHLDVHGARELRRIVIQRSGTKQCEPRWEYVSVRVKSTRNEAVPDGPKVVPDVKS